MTQRDRILAAVCGDLESAELVESLLRRSHRPSGTDGESASPAVAPTERICQRCHSSRLVDEYGYCSECAFQNTGPGGHIMTHVTAFLPYQRRRLAATEAYRARLRERLERAPEDIAWRNRAPVVLAALVLQEERRRSADILLLCTAGVIR